MKFFKPSMISLVVCSSLASMANAGENTNFFDASLKPQSAQFGLYQGLKKADLDRQITVSGMRSQFDDSLNRPTFIWASKSQAMPSFEGVEPESRDRVAAEFYLGNLTGVSTERSFKNKAVLSNLQRQKSGSLVAKYKQEVYGVEVFNREFNIMMTAERELVAASGFLAERRSIDSTNAAVNFGTAEQALKSAFRAMGGEEQHFKIKADDTLDKKYQRFSVDAKGEAYQVLNQPRAKRVMYELDGKLIAAHYVEIEAGKADELSSDYYAYVIAADSGRVLYKKNLVNSEKAFNYRVYADTTLGNIPHDGPFGDVSPWPVAKSENKDHPTEITEAKLVSLVAGPISTNDPWLADDATTTSGNNVVAYVDAVAPSGFSNGDYYAETTSDATFDYPLKPDQKHYSVDNRKAAITNLFYVNNYLHDQFYDHGFDEKAGNAQKVNYGRGGVEGDPIQAEAQDNSGFNNANMATPADGASPRMQMYLYDDFISEIGEDYGVSIVGDSDTLLESTQVSNFGARRFSAPVVGDVVRMIDGDDADGGSVYDGCQAPTNAADLAGKIAIIDRGGCNFTVKVKFAQDAGAIGALVANTPSRDPDGKTPAPMGGDDDTVKIPNMGLSSTDGQAIYDAIEAGNSKISMFNDTPYRDGTFDNGTVAHEWGHYISNRLVGNSSGLVNNQGRAMGEGWGDFHALLLMVREDDAKIEGNELFQAAYTGSGYTDNFYFGIRRAPYSTQMDINPLTFKHIEQGVDLPEGVRVGSNNAQVHASGEIWALTLWEVYVALINDERYTFKEAQSLMMDYLVAGYKMTPIAPTYTEARDAILSVAYARDVEDYKVMLGAFAKRGLGLGAVSPERFDDTHSGVVESFKTDLATYSLVDTKIETDYRKGNLGYCSNDSVLDNGETGTVTVKIANSGNKVLNNVKVKLVMETEQDVTFANDGEYIFDTLAPYSTATSSPIEITLAGAAIADQLRFKVTFPELVEGDDIVEAVEETVTATVNYDFELRTPKANSDFDDVESVAGFANWTENVQVGGDDAKGTAFLDQASAAIFDSFGLDTGTQMLGMTNNGFKSDVSFETKEFEVGYNGDFSVSWWHYFDLEEDWDGGVVEVSVNGGDWADVTKMGGTFATGYTGALEENEDQVLSERETFTGFAFGNESVNFGSALNGNKVRFRFRLGSDAFANEDGWYIDNIRFNNIESGVFHDVVAGDIYACNNRAPVIAEVTGESVAERVSAGGAFNTGELTVTASDVDENELTYTWTQISGPDAALNNANSATAVYTAPQVSADTELVFEVAVSDGTVSVVKQVTVMVTEVADKAPELPETKKNSSSGSLGFSALLLAPLIWLRRRNLIK